MDTIRSSMDIPALQKRVRREVMAGALAPEVLAEFVLEHIPACKRSDTVRYRSQRILVDHFSGRRRETRGLIPLRFRFGLREDGAGVDTTVEDPDDIGTQIQRLCDSLQITDEGAREAIATAVFAAKHPGAADDADEEPDQFDTEESDDDAGSSIIGKIKTMTGAPREGAYGGTLQPLRFRFRG